MFQSDDKFIDFREFFFLRAIFRRNWIMMGDLYMIDKITVCR